MKRKIFLCITCLFLLGLTAQAEDFYIVKLSDSAGLFSVEERNGGFYSVTAEELQDCLDMGIVEYYEPDYEVKLFSEDVLWNFSAVNIQKPHDIGCYGNGVKVGVIDSGIYVHPQLEGRVSEGYNYIENSNDVTDNIGHGTFVSGIIASKSAGLATQAQIVPLKCFDSGVTTRISSVANALYDAVDVYGCDVVNMSFGTSASGTSTTFKLAVAHAIQSGCIVVAAVGNDGTNTVYYPANYDGVVGVGSIDEDFNISYFSQHNISVDVVAPGRGLTGVSIDGYTKNSGTSFSAPHVSAIAAIAKCIDKSITPQEFNLLIQTTSTDPDNDGYDEYFGYGIVNAQGIVDSLLQDVNYFLSPITNGCVKLYNNTNITLKATALAAVYDGELYKEMTTFTINLLPGEVADIFFGEGENKTLMLWKSSAFCPLLPYRKY